MNARRDLRRNLSAARPLRRGLSLFELVIVISMLAVLMSFGTVLLGLLLRADSVGQEALAGQLAISRLSRQFRSDLHVARDVLPAVDGDAGSLVVTLDDGRRVTWSVEDATVQRSVVSDATEIARDSYMLPEGDATFVRDDAAGVIALRHAGRRPPVVEHGAAGAAAPPEVLVIEAAVGTERRALTTEMN